MFEDINFMNHMYTKISDLKSNKYDNNKIYDLKSDKYDNNNKIYDLKSDKYDNNKIYDNNNTKTDLSYLFYKENKKNKKNKKDNKNKENNENKKKCKNNKIILYMSLFILFCILNSYYIINLINSYKIQYNVSLFIRALIFIFIYYLINIYKKN